MADLKKKFIDILFEDDPNEQEIEENSNLSSPEVKQVRKEAPILAKDILYHKSGSSAFINLDETVGNKDTHVQVESVEEYEMSSQISPIFGVIKENTKKTINVNPEITESLTSRPTDSHLDIITSPIYGYGNKENAIDNNYEVRNIVDDSVQEVNEEDELHHLFDEEESLNRSYDTMTNDSSNDDEISLFRLFGENK